jgi:hypothetical protein
MTQGHPSEIELLELVEGDLDEPQAQAVRGHTAACASCSEALAELEAGRDVLRASPVLELPDATYRHMLEALGPQEGTQPSRLASRFTWRRVALVLAPVAGVVAAVAIGLSVADGGGGERESAPAAAEAADASAEQAPLAEDAGGADAPAAGAAEAAPPAAESATSALESAARAVVRSVEGPAAEVARLLSEAGLDARVVDGTVEVRGADPARVEELLEGRADGGVDVVAVPAG